MKESIAELFHEDEDPAGNIIVGIDEITCIPRVCYIPSWDHRPELLEMALEHPPEVQEPSREAQAYEIGRAHV